MSLWSFWIITIEFGISHEIHNPIGEEDAKSLVSHRNRHCFLRKDTNNFFIKQNILIFLIIS